MSPSSDKTYTQLGPIKRASLCLRTFVPAPRWGPQAKHRKNHLRGLRKHEIIKKFVLIYHRHKLLDLIILCYFRGRSGYNLLLNNL
jgi:hypothetical protein